jgi:NADH dehydrogenase
VHRVVILGGGFGGLYAAKALRHVSVDVTLIDRRNFHLFQPLLYQVATGSLSPGEIAAPLRALLRKQSNVRVLLGEAIELDVPGRRVILADGDVPYDTLIVSTGARTHYFGHEDWQRYGPGLKSIEDAGRIRSRLLYAFEAAEREPDEVVRRAWLTFVIVGAGPTGVELAGALAEIAQDTLRQDFRTIHTEESRILLLDAGPRLLAAFPEKLSTSAQRQLVRLGVRPRTKAHVIALDRDGVTIQTTTGVERIESRTVVWAAGVAPSEFAQVLARAAASQLDRQGRVMVEPDLTVRDHPEIFVIGDLACCEQDGLPVPGVAPVAMQQGRYAAQVLKNRLESRGTRPFHYRNKGNLAVIGRAAGVADFGALRFSGWIAWLLWLFVHLMYLAQFRNRLLVFVRWGFQYLTFDRGARLITRDPGSLGEKSSSLETNSSKKK